MVDRDFVQDQAKRLFKYFQAKNLSLGMMVFPSVDKLEVLIEELCNIAQMEGNASDAYIQVLTNQNGNLVVRPVVKIQKKKKNEED